MTGWDFAKYLVDMMYSHWLTTIVFLCIIFRCTLLNLSSSEKEKE